MATPIRRRTFLHAAGIGFGLGCAGVLSGCGSRAVQPGTVVKRASVGFLSSSTADASPEQEAALRSRLAELGWVEGRNMAFEPRFSNGDTGQALDYLAQDLLSTGPNVVVAKTPAAAVSAWRLNRHIPIVLDNQSFDPMGAGIIQSYGRSGTNVTGVAGMIDGIREKRIEILHRAFPAAKTVGILWIPGLEGESLYKTSEAAALALGLRAVSMKVPAPDEDDIAATFRTAAPRPGQLLAVTEQSVSSFAAQIVSLAAEHRLAAIYPLRQFEPPGGLMYYGPDNLALNRRAAEYVDLILRGANPGDLPVEQPAGVEFVVNLITAKAQGLEIPESVLAQATRVIK